jgi:hypothetical protein
MSVPSPTVVFPSGLLACCHFQSKNSDFTFAALGTLFQLTKSSAWFCTTSATKPISIACTSLSPLPEASRVFSRVQ